MDTVFPAIAPVTLPILGDSRHFPVRRVFCIGRNYAAHAREMGKDPEREPPFFFMKPASDLVAVGAGGVSIAYPQGTKNLHHEIELVAAIGNSGANLGVAEAEALVWGYAVGLDMTRRDLQLASRDLGRPWEIGKAFHQSAPIGSLVPKSKLPSIGTARITLAVDGKPRQDATIAELIWSVPETIAHISQYYRLEPGDLIFTGTPAGVGAVEPGHVLLGAIEGLGEIQVTIAPPLTAAT